ncbi:MAG: kinE 9, partial [Rhodospirillales bacterium]|nr:kinE 9 [Rhodospirillales bacterium]
MSETLNILLCEPDDAEATRLTDHLDSHSVGCNVDTVAAVQDVPAVLANRQWDLVLCAHAVSTFNARQILDVVRAADPDLPVIVLASEITEAESAALIIAGARDVMRRSDLSRLIPIILREIESARTRRELSQAVGRAELHFRNIVEASLQGIMVRVNSKTQFVNSAFCKMFGYSADELMNLRSMGDLHPESERGRIQQHVQDRYSGDMSIYEYEIEGVRKDGSTFWCSKMASHVEWDGQRAVQIVIVDISERKKTEQQLAERERIYRETFENAPVALLRTNRDREIIEANLAFANMLGYPVEEIIGHRVGEFAPRTDTTHVVPEIRKVWTREIDHLDTEHRMVRKDGREIWVQSSARLTPGSGDGANATEMLAQFQDITRRHEAEISLRERETLYRVLVEKSLQGILIINQNAKPIFVNNVFAEMLGYTPNDILALDAGISLYHEEDRQEIRRRMGLRKAGDDSVQRYELRAIKKDGATIWVDIMTTAIEWSGQRAVQVAVIDITERKTSARLIEEREKRYRQTFEHAPIAMTRSMRDSSIVEANQAFADILGCSVKELDGARISDFVAPEDSSANMHVLHKVWQREVEQADIEHQMTRKDGRHIWVHCSVRLDSPEWTPSAGSEHEAYMLAQFQDITSRREAEAELLRRETLYRNLVEQSLQGVLVADHSGKPLFVNGVFANIFGYPPDEILAMTSGISLYHPEDQKDLRRRRTQRNAGDQSAQRYEIRGIKKDGTTIWLELLSVAIDWQGQIATQVAAIDITDRKINAHLLEARELKYRQTFQNAPIAMFRIDRHRFLHDVNQAFVDLVGYTKEDLHGIPAHDLIHPTDLETVRRRTSWVWNGRVERIENEYR